MIKTLSKFVINVKKTPGILGQKQTLPEFMLGEFKMETSEGFEDFLYEIGINWLNRKAELSDAEVDYLFLSL